MSTSYSRKTKAGMAHSDCRWTRRCAGKAVKSLENMWHTWALLRRWFTALYQVYVPLPLVSASPFCLASVSAAASELGPAAASSSIPPRLGRLNSSFIDSSSMPSTLWIWRQTTCLAAVYTCNQRLSTRTEPTRLATQHKCYGKLGI